MCSRLTRIETPGHHLSFRETVSSHTLHNNSNSQLLFILVVVSYEIKEWLIFSLSRHLFLLPILPVFDFVIKVTVHHYPIFHTVGVAFVTVSELKSLLINFHDPSIAYTHIRTICMCYLINHITPL